MDRHTPAKKCHDWHPSDIKAALEKAGWSLSRLSVHNGLSRNALAQALKPSHTYGKAEARIAAALGVPPQQIWPSRYNEDGTRKAKRLGNPNWLPGVSRKSSQDGTCCHVKERQAA
jgi:Ner family transcriptional regulator